MLIQRVALNHMPSTAAAIRAAVMDSTNSCSLRFALCRLGWRHLDRLAHAHHGHFLERGCRDMLVKTGVLFIGANQAQVLQHRHDEATRIDGLSWMQRMERLGGQLGCTFHDGVDILGRSPAREPHALATVLHDAQVEFTRVFVATDGIGQDGTARDRGQSPVNCSSTGSISGVGSSGVSAWLSAGISDAFSVVISSMGCWFQTWKYSLVEIDKWKEMNDLNGLSYKVDRLPQSASGQQRQHFFRVLSDHIKQGQTLGKFTSQATIELPDGCAFVKCFMQVAVQLGNQISDDFIGGCGHAVLLSAGEKPPRGWLVAVNEQVSWIDALLYWRGMQLTQGQ